METVEMWPQSRLSNRKPTARREVRRDAELQTPLYRPTTRRRTLLQLKSEQLNQNEEREWREVLRAEKREELWLI